jgi:hypothetical protein
MAFTCERFMALVLTLKIPKDQSKQSCLFRPMASAVNDLDTRKWPYRAINAG